jgi:hypothetical protein
MSGTAPPVGDPLLQSSATRVSRHGGGVDARRVTEVLRASGPSLLFGLRLWVSVSLALYVAFWLEEGTLLACSQFNRRRVVEREFDQCAGFADGRARNGAAADHVAQLEITAASRSKTCEWLPPSGAAGSLRIAPAVLNEMQFSSFDVVQITIDIYMPWCAA